MFFLNKGSISFKYDSKNQSAVTVDSKYSYSVKMYICAIILHTDCTFIFPFLHIDVPFSPNDRVTLRKTYEITRNCRKCIFQAAFILRHSCEHKTKIRFIAVET